LEPRGSGRSGEVRHSKLQDRVAVIIDPAPLSFDGGSEQAPGLDLVRGAGEVPDCARRHNGDEVGPRTGGAQGDNHSARANRFRHELTSDSPTKLDFQNALKDDLPNVLPNRVG